MAQLDSENYAAAYRGSKKRLGQLQRRARVEKRIRLMLAIAVASIYLALLRRWYRLG
jgi:hypothetical protein